MNCIIPFESKVKFDYPVKEICSISLEHEITKNDDELLGNFFITGTCKEYELSVNTKDFEFIIPFSVNYTNKIDIASLEFNIDNFTYDLKDNELQVKIDYSLVANDLPKEQISVDPYDLIEEDTKDFEREEPIMDNNDSKNSYAQELTNFQMEDDYATYHVHFVKKDETIESICKFYKIDKDDLLRCNNLDSIEGCSHLLIPLKDE